MAESALGTSSASGQGQRPQQVNNASKEGGSTASTIAVGNGVGGFNSNYIQVKQSQRGNPVLDCIKNVSWQYNSSIMADYVMGSTCALFISVRYHMLHPNYLYRRMKEIGSDFRNRIVLCQVDVEDNVKALLELNKLCFTHRFTLMLSWSPLEAGRYLETFKSYENKPSTSIQEKVETEFLPQVTNVLKSVKSINRTDVVTLFEAFRHFQGICAAEESQLLLCPGLGEKKVKRLHHALHTPFKRAKSSHHGTIADNASRDSSTAREGTGEQGDQKIVANKIKNCKSTSRCTGGRVPAPFAAVCGVAPGGIPAYSCDYKTADPSVWKSRHRFRHENHGLYYGYRYQCVEFSRRWLIHTQGITFGDVGMAYEIFHLTFAKKVSDGTKVSWNNIPNGSSLVQCLVLS
jgi:DNA repair protein Rad10